VLSCHYDTEMEMPNVSHVPGHTVTPLAKLKPVCSSIVKSAPEELKYKHLLHAYRTQVCLLLTDTVGIPH
jgi:hypothetical protein